MEVGVIGLSHRLARLQVREAFAKVCSRRFEPGSSTHGDAHTFVLLSTCNRTEIYFSSVDLARTHSYLLGIFHRDGAQGLDHLLYSFFHKDCLAHLASVVSGLDSAIVGETEIQGQVARAYETAKRFAKLPSDVHSLFQKCLHIGKQVRSTHPLLRGSDDIDSVIFKAAAKLFPKVTDCRVLFAGASEINDKVLRKFKAKGLAQLALCNRSAEKAQLLAKRVGVRAVDWPGAEEWLAYDILVFGTTYPFHLLRAAHLPRELSSSRLVVDLSVPRNVDPLVAEHAKLTLLNIETIHDALDSQRRLQRAALQRAGRDVRGAVERHWELYADKRRMRLALGA